MTRPEIAIRAALCVAMAACGGDGARTAPDTGPAGAVRVFGEAPNSFFEDYIGAATISPDGRRAVLSAIPGFIRFLDLETGRLVEDPVPGTTGLYGAAFGPHGEWAV